MTGRSASNDVPREKGDLNSSPYHHVSAVLSRLDLALLLRQPSGRFLLPGPKPIWWREYAGPQADNDTFIVNDDHPFMANFLVEAERFWSENESGYYASGAWEKSFGNTDLELEVYALRFGEDCLLVIENVRSKRFHQRQMISAGRSTRLELLRDISRRQQLEMELRDARDAALQLDHAKGKLLANTSHELRTPLAGVLGMLELAIENREDRAGHLRDAYELARGLQRIVSDLLDYASLEAGNPRLELSAFCLIELLQELQRDFLPAAAEKGLKLCVNAPTDLGRSETTAWEITSDRTRVRQILNNLVDNAIRYTDEGSVTVSLSRGPSGIHQLAVCDTGRGVSKFEQQLIFEAFRRGGSSKLHDGGSGLGLAIARDLVEALAGDLRLESELGKGTTFRVDLPGAAPVENANPSTREADALDSGAILDQPKISSGLRFLVAEDNLANRIYLVHVLRSAQITVDEVENGIDLIDRACSRDYDMILTDCRMSGLGGLEAATIIRQREQGTRRRVPIIAVTAHTARRDSEPFLTAGVDDILIKPFTRAELLEKIAPLVNRKDASSTE